MNRSYAAGTGKVSALKNVPKLSGDIEKQTQDVLRVSRGIEQKFRAELAKSGECEHQMRPARKAVTGITIMNLFSQGEILHQQPRAVRARDEVQRSINVYT
jgi:hypothetical protein